MTAPGTTSYASLEDLEDRLDWELSTAEQGIAESALEDLSDDARYYGRDWPVDSAPRQVRSVVLRAAQRFMRNVEGYVQSRAGDETVVWSDTHKQGGSASFSTEEIEILRGVAGSTTNLSSAPVEAWGTSPRRFRHHREEWRSEHCEGFVPVGDAGDRFPLYNDDCGPW